jgi:pilus assembly protein CpaC
MPQHVNLTTSFWRTALLLLACGLAPLGLPGMASGQQTPLPGTTPATDAKVNALIAEVLEPEARMALTTHHSKVIRTKVPVTRISITDPRTMEINQFSPTEFELIGLQAGQTSFTLWFGANQALRYSVTVKPDTEARKRAEAEYGELQRRINEMFPNSMVQLIPIADKLIVRGQAKDSAEATQIMAVLSESQGYGRGGNYRGGSTTGAAGAANVAAGGAGGGAGFGSLNMGTAAQPNPSERDLPPHSIISLLNVPGEQQVLLKVRVAELSRTAARNLTAQLRVNNGSLALSTESGGLSTVFSSVLNPEDIRLAIKAVSTTGYTKILAEPNLVTLNGQPANFLAGGQFPVPTAVNVGGIAGINTQFQAFGTQLTFTPTIIDKDRIRLVVTPTVSQINEDVSVQGIPGLSSRTVTTTVDLRTGQWLAIAGLIQDQQHATRVRVPFVGDLPVVGALFGRTDIQREETELIVLVGPELVHPMDAQEVPLILPGMEVAEPTDPAFFLAGAYIAKATDQPGPSRGGAACAADMPRRVTREAMSRPVFQRSEKYYVYGPHGASQ